MGDFRFTFGRTPTTAVAGALDSSSNVNLDWLLGLNKGLGDDSPDTQRFRDIISAESIQIAELLKWLEQAQAVDDDLHRKAFNDILTSLTAKLGFQVEYGLYQPSAPFAFHSLWKSSRGVFGLRYFYDRVEIFDTKALRSDLEQFFAKYDIPVSDFTCLLLLGRDCSPKVEAQVAAWSAQCQLRLLKLSTYLELISMVQHSVLSLDEMGLFLGAGRLLYIDDIMRFTQSFLDGTPQARPLPRQAVTEEASLPKPSGQVPQQVERQTPRAASSVPVSQHVDDEEIVSFPEPEPDPEIIVTHVPVNSQNPQMQAHSQEDEVVETVEFVEEDDESINAIRGRVAALGAADEEIVVVDESGEEPAPDSPLARLAALDAQSPAAPSVGPAPTPASSPPPTSSSTPSPVSTPTPAPVASQDISALEQVVAQNPGNMAARVQLGKLYARSNQFDKAIEAIKKVINEESDHIMANLVLGEIHFRKKEYPKAALSYDVVLNKDPNNVEALMNLGKVYLAQEKFSRALKVFQRASKASPQPSADIELKVAKVYYLQEKLDKALVHLKNARDIDPKNVNVYLALGHYYLDTKDPVEAKKAFEAGLKLDPDNIKLQTYVNNLQ